MATKQPVPGTQTGLVVGEPERHREPSTRRGLSEVWTSIIGPFAEFFRRHGSLVVLLFILVHKIGDTLGQLVLRLLLNDMGYSNDEIAIYDVGFGFWAYLIGIFIGGFLYTQIGFAMFCGWVVYDHVPGALELAGMGLIVLCGATASWLTAREKRLPVEPPEA